MRTCQSCGGIIGQECFNPGACAEIAFAQDQQQRHDLEARIQNLERIYEESRFADNIQVSKDGDKWCALIGPDLQTGIAGFGDTPSEAVVALTKHEAFSEWSNNLH